jgi:hypothetical protein
MDKEQIGNLLCTDTVRRGTVDGTVVESTPTHVKIAWDGQGNTPTTYAKTTYALKDVRIERQADRVERGGRTVGFHTRPCTPENREDPYDAE